MGFLRAILRSLVNLVEGTVLGIFFVVVVLTQLPMNVSEPEGGIEIAALFKTSSIITTKSILTREDGHLVYASWPVTESAEINSRIDGFIAGRLAEFESALVNLEPRNGDIRPELNLTFDVPLETESLLVIEFNYGAYDGPADAKLSRTFIFQKTSGSLLPYHEALDLNVDAKAFIVTSIINQLKQHRIQPGYDFWQEPDLGTAVEEGEPTIAILGDGQLTITYQADDFISSDTEVLNIKIPMQGLRDDIPVALQGLVFGTRAASLPDQMPSSDLDLPVARDPIDCAHEKCVALTFDDGPGIHTARLLDLLKAEEVPATFFLVGHRVRFHTGDVRRMILDGHQVGNHSWTHPQLTRLSSDAVRSEIQRTNAAITAESDLDVDLFRPPYGLFNTRVRTDVAMPIMLWNKDTMDWRALDADIVAWRTANDPPSGSIVLLHDIHKTTVDAMPRAIASLKDKGYTFVTLEDLFAPHEPAPMTVYESRASAPQMAEGN